MKHIPTSFIYVSPTGGASATGTKNDPASFARAKQLVVAGGAMPLVWLLGGVYTMSEFLEWTDTESSVNAGRYVKISNYPGEVVSVSGGIPITGPWTGPDANGVYSKSFTGTTRNLWVNGLRCPRAKKIYGTDPPGPNYSPGWIETAVGFDSYTLATGVTCTISNGTPGVVTLNGHGLTTGSVVHFTTTGALPTGLTAYVQGNTNRVVYYVNVINANTFSLALTKADAIAGTVIATTSAGSGTHTCVRYTPDTSIASTARPTDVEIFASEMGLWKVWRLRVASVNGHEITIREIDWTNAHSHGAPFVVTHRSIIHIENAKEWVQLGQGYWYHDRVANIIYYKPRTGEVMGTVSVVAGNLETSMKFNGTPDNKVHMRVAGIIFEYSTWLLPDTMGYNTVQSGVHGYHTGVAGETFLQMPGMIELEHADVDFPGCFVRRTGNAGIRFKDGCVEDRINDTTITDIGGNGVTNGTVQSLTDYTSPAENTKNKNLKVLNCTITWCGMDFWDGCGVFETVAGSTEVAQCDINNIAYSAGSFGWYWGLSDISMDAASMDFHHNKVIRSNQKCGDGGPIYTLGHHPGGRVHDNYFEREQWGHMQPIYHDNGSRGFTTTNNAVKTNGDASTKWLYINASMPAQAVYNIVTGNYYDVGTAGSYSPTNTVSGNIVGPFGPEALAIIANAGRR